MFKKSLTAFTVAAALLLLGVACFFLARIRYPRPYLQTVLNTEIDPFLVYAVIKAESGFDEGAVSGAGAVGLMQLKPSTAEFICVRDGIEFCPSQLKDGAYNVLLGCRYLKYLSWRFPVQETALAAYNAGEGTVSIWLNDTEFSDDGKILKKIPYRETREYVKKIAKYRKIYRFLYG